jgi:hypothetical protein
MSCSREPRRLRSFLTLFGVQTVGAAIIYWNVLPHYRWAIAGEKSLQVEFEASIWPIAAIALIQSGYWISRRIQPPLPQYTNALLGLCLLFLARMGLCASDIHIWLRIRFTEIQLPDSGISLRYYPGGLILPVLLPPGFRALSFLGRKPDRQAN